MEVFDELPYCNAFLHLTKRESSYMQGVIGKNIAFFLSHKKLGPWIYSIVTQGFVVFPKNCK